MKRMICQLTVIDDATPIEYTDFEKRILKATIGNYLMIK